MSACSGLALGALDTPAGGAANSLVVKAGYSFKTPIARLADRDLDRACLLSSHRCLVTLPEYKALFRGNCDGQICAIPCTLWLHRDRLRARHEFPR